MKEKLFQIVKKFLAERHETGKPLLLGFSGGADSMALLHLLIECRVPLHAAHVDHSWRQESRDEALGLKRYVEGLGIPFHLHLLIPPIAKKNLEDGARRERLSFFRQLYRDLGCQALLLAHHRDDQSETVLKRLLEGASLCSLGGLQPASLHDGMPLWRPLLSATKNEIEAYLRRQGISWIEDASNKDPAFLRARMRVQIFPELAKQFGKEIGANLSRLGTTAQELKRYLNKQTQPFWDAVEKYGTETRIDFAPFFPLEPLEVKAFLRQLADREGVSLSTDSFEKLYFLIESKASNRRIVYKDFIFKINRAILILELNNATE